jgi:Ca-activated chloride channel family protein
MTPIQRSLQRAVEIARTLQGEGELTVVLVSDGKETCDPDPCGTVRQLKTSGAKFVAHVIGFDVGADEREQLACIAEAAGGKYYSAANAADLMFATQAATSTLVEAPASGEGRV